MNGIRIKKTNGNLVLHGSTKSYSLLTKKTFTTAMSISQTTFTVATELPPLVFLRSASKLVCFLTPAIRYISPGLWEIPIDWYQTPLDTPLNTSFYRRGGPAYPDDSRYLEDTLYVYVFGDAPPASGYGLLLKSGTDTFTISDRSLVIKDRGSLDLNAQYIEWVGSGPAPVGGTSFIATTPNPYPNARCGKRLPLLPGISSPAICTGMVSQGKSIEYFKDFWSNYTDYQYVSPSGHFVLGVPPCATAGPSYYATWQGSFPLCRQKKVISEMMDFLVIDTALYD